MHNDRVEVLPFLALFSIKMREIGSILSDLNSINGPSGPLQIFHVALQPFWVHSPTKALNI